MHTLLSPGGGFPSTSQLDPRDLAALAKTRNFTTETIRLLLRCKELILLAKALALGQWRDSRDPISGAFAEHCQAEIKAVELREALDIIRGRILRMPPAHRKRYSPEERFRIVVFVRTHSLTYAEAADLFLVDPQTISRWTAEATREPDRKTVGSLLKASPPVRALSDVTRELVALLDAMRVGGSRRIAHMLVRAGRAVSHETVRRYRRNRAPLAPAPSSSGTGRAALRASGPNHMWMTDITDVPSLFRIWIFKLVVVLDVYSRLPLAFKVFAKEPASQDIAALVENAAARFGTPKHFVTDRGSQFTARTFTEKLRHLGIAQRFGAIGRTGSIAIIERLWRTLKEMLDLKFTPPLSRRHLQQKIEQGLFYYSTLRPHQGLDGATPAEIYFGLTPATESARDRDGPSPPPLDLAYLDRERRLPFLIPKLAA